MKLLQDPRKRAWLATGLLALLALALVGPFVYDANARHLSAYAGGDEDASTLRLELARVSGESASILATPHVLADIQEPERTLLVILGPERPYDPDEAQAILQFLQAGGRVLLADETNHGNAIAQAAGWAYGSQRVLDTRNAGEPKLVVSSARLDGQTYPLLFNAPSLLVPPRTGDYEVLAQSSPATQYPDGSYLDADGDGEIEKESPGPFPLVARTQVGRGTLVLVADTGLFMNQQLGVLDYQNGEFLRTLVGTLIPRDGTILYDEARHAPGAPTALWANSARTLARATTGDYAPFVLLAALLGATALAWRATRATEDWSHHAHDVGADVPLPEDVRPDLARAQRLARRRISENYNIPMEQVAAMTPEQLLSLTGDRMLADAAAGTLRADPTPLFPSFSPREASP